MKRLVPALLLCVIAGCDRANPAPGVPTHAPAPAATFADARGRFLDCMAGFEAHAWDSDGAARGKTLAELGDAGAGLVAVAGSQSEVPAAAISRVTRRVSGEAAGFSGVMEAFESSGKPSDAGLPWPYEYKEAAMLARCLLAETASEAVRKRQAFARLASRCAVYEILHESPADPGLKDAQERLCGAASALLGEDKGLTRVEREDLLRLMTAFAQGASPAPEEIAAIRIGWREISTRPVDAAPDFASLARDKRWFLLFTMSQLETALPMWSRRYSASPADQPRLAGEALESAKAASKAAGDALSRQDLTIEEREVFREVAGLATRKDSGTAEAHQVDAYELLDSLRRLVARK